MGNLCLPSKEPQSEDRQRIFDGTEDQPRYVEPRSGAADRRTGTANSGGTAPIGVPGVRTNGVDTSQMSRSYTEARMEEEEGFFESIIKRTENNFLNAHDDSDALGPSRDTAQLSRYLATQDRTPAGAAVLPVASVRTEDVEGVLSAPVVNSKDTAWMKEALAVVTAAVAEVQVEHKTDVVVPLPDFGGTVT